ncbi:type III-B CRISPR-associated protein Cas10/Cmr2 [Pullulanibacillus camelliae]|uniref:Type III-B CRISPR-associated protein Cas10/Cmr2 n=1 Tax=Pullulanibacillus camelliae TaxID=1707096 RepID=A0A8J2VL09_9BACL|nr:type III-B CRISPR-associated protein Cas10/Cmr2 [Pullulanibacillus camelliae]GGE35347.1 type III-B CRISPR-associated protein Cas10/Cmr2 [Pullulanibacillus camelliae]
MTNWFLLFKIGPVQSFISHSRKMRDLYAGSFLLSYLITHAIEFVQKEKDVEVILPKKTVSLPNQILLLDRQGESHVDNLAHRLEKSVRDEFYSICRTLFTRLDIVVPNEVWDQLSSFPEIYWVYQEHDHSRPNFSFEHIMDKLQSVKSLRLFSQSAEKAGRKCALFPEYNALYYKKRKDGKTPNYLVPEAVEITRDIPWQYALNPGESLSALALIKRMFYFLKDKFSSYNVDIISVASMLLDDEFKTDKKLNALWRTMSPEAAEAIFDLQNGLPLSDAEYKREEQAVAKTLVKSMDQAGLVVSPYYAVTKFDGDGIGSLYKECSPEEQKRLSKEIGNFAGEAPAIIREHGGMCIYAGGEDFLGFFPLDAAIPALLELREKFQEKVPPPNGKVERLTFSAGIVIAHLMPPLQDVLALVDEMEHFAKENPGKDSFAIAVSKRSGGSLSVRNKFGKGGSHLRDLLEISDSIGKREISVSSLHQLISVLEGIIQQHDGDEEDMVETLIRQSMYHHDNDLTPNEQMCRCLIDFYHQYDRHLPSFLSALEIAIFLGKAVS